MQTGPASELSFDLSQASARLWPFTRRSLRVSVFAVCFLIAFGLFIVLASLNVTVHHRSLNTYQVFGLSVVLVVVAYGLGITIPLIRRQRRGAISLRVDNEVLDLAYPNGDHVTTSWSDPRLDFTLFDFTGADPEVLPTWDFPHEITMKGVESLLTDSAYLAILEQIARHGLSDEVRRGGTWLFPARANPLVHHVRAAERSSERRPK
jgi:hypothetical protein